MSFQRPPKHNYEPMLKKLQDDPNLLALYEECFDWCMKTESYSYEFWYTGVPATPKTLLEKLEFMGLIQSINNRKKGSYYTTVDDVDFENRIEFPPSFAPFIHVLKIRLAMDAAIDTLPTRGLENCTLLEFYKITAPLTKIEVDFSNIKTDFHLCLHGLQTSNIPLAIVTNPRIISLELSSELNTIPATVAKYQGRGLSLSYPNAPFASFLLQLPYLKGLSLELKTIPTKIKDIGHWKSITLLTLKSDTLKAIPEWIQQINYLNWLRIEAIWITDLPRWLFDCAISEFLLENWSLTQAKVDAFEAELAAHLAPLTEKERRKKLNIFNNFWTCTEEELKIAELKNYTEKIQEKITDLQTINRPLLAREQLEINFLEKIQAAINRENLAVLAVEITNTVADLDLQTQLLQYVEEKKALTQ